MAKKSIIQEAVADAKEIKRVALENAETIVMEHLKENMKSFVDAKLNEQDSDVADEAPCDEETNMAETTVNEMDELDLSDVMDDEEGEEEMEDMDADEGEEDGLDEADLSHALDLVLREVEVGDLGEVEVLDRAEGENGEGLTNDRDAKEGGHETKTAPAAKDWTVKENAYKTKIKGLVSEVVSLRKALKITKAALTETSLFNRKLFYANKLMNKVSDTKMKKEIVRRMDSVKSLAEAKNLYESLDMALGLMSESARPAPAAKKPSLAEVLGSQKSTEKGVSNVDTSHLNETAGSASRDRMMVLAGLKKS